MIKVTVWNENVQENGLKFAQIDESIPESKFFKEFLCLLYTSPSPRDA